MGDRPAALADALGSIGAVKYPGVAKIAVGAGKAVVQFLLGHMAERAEQVLPNGAHCTRVVDHLVGNTRQCAIGKGGIDAYASLCLFFSLNCRFLGHAVLWSNPGGPPQIECERKFL